MAEVTRILPGWWGISRILPGARGGWTTAAMRQQLSRDGIDAYYPPLVGGIYPIPFALVRCRGTVDTVPDADIILCPVFITAGQTVGDLTTAQRTRFRASLGALCPPYQFTDWDSTVQTRAAFQDQLDGYTNATSLEQWLRDFYTYLAHSTSRPRPALAELHNTETTDDFSTDPFSAPRWTNEGGTAVWDS